MLHILLRIFVTMPKSIIFCAKSDFVFMTYNENIQYNYSDIKWSLKIEKLQRSYTAANAFVSRNICWIYSIVQNHAEKLFDSVSFTKTCNFLLCNSQANTFFFFELFVCDHVLVFKKLTSNLIILSKTGNKSFCEVDRKKYQFSSEKNVFTFKIMMHS